MAGSRKIRAAMKKMLEPFLANEGFTGKYPHFQRKESGSLQLLSVIYDKWGGGFVLEFVGKAKVKKAVPPIITLLQSKSYFYPPVRRSMIKALWSLRAVEAIPALESLEPFEREESLNKLVAETLTRLRKTTLE